MIALGVILIIFGLVFPTLHILWTLGIVLLVVGAVLWILARSAARSPAAVLVLDPSAEKKTRARLAGTRLCFTEHT